MAVTAATPPRVPTKAKVANAGDGQPDYYRKFADGEVDMWKYENPIDPDNHGVFFQANGRDAEKIRDGLEAMITNNGGTVTKGAGMPKPAQFMPNTTTIFLREADLDKSEVRVGYTNDEPDFEDFFEQAKGFLKEMADPALLRAADITPRATAPLSQRDRLINACIKVVSDAYKQTFGETGNEPGAIQMADYIADSFFTPEAYPDYNDKDRQVVKDAIARALVNVLGDEDTLNAKRETLLDETREKLRVELVKTGNPLTNTKVSTALREAAGAAYNECYDDPSRDAAPEKSLHVKLQDALASEIAAIFHGDDNKALVKQLTDKAYDDTLTYWLEIKPSSPDIRRASFLDAIETRALTVMEGFKKS